jgi:AcrR family transcriptional regulator
MLNETRRFVPFRPYRRDREMSREMSTSSESATQSQGRRNQKSRRALLTALEELLVENPLTSISIEGIAERAGVGKQTIYRWYRDRSELFIDLYETRSIDQLMIPDRGSVERELNELAVQTWRLWRDTACGRAFGQLVARTQTSPDELERFRDEFMPRRRTLVEQVLRRGVERGEVRDADHEVFIDLWIGFNWHHLLMNKLADESVIPRMVDMLLEGMMVD